MRPLAIALALFAATLGRGDIFDFKQILVPGSGGPSNGHTLDSATSLNGRFIAFVTNKPHLRPKDDPFTYDIFVYDRTTTRYRWVNVDEFGFRVHPNFDMRSGWSELRGLQVSDTGDVAFEGSTLQNSRNSVYFYRTSTRRARLVLDPATYNMGFSLLSLSRDGKYLGLQGGSAGKYYRFDLSSPSLVETATPYYSPDGNWQVFFTDRRDIVPPFPTNKRYGVYAERIGSTERYLMYAGDVTSVHAVSDGAFKAAFAASGVGITPSDINSQTDAFVIDRISGGITHVNRRSNGLPITGVRTYQFAADTSAALFVTPDAGYDDTYYSRDLDSQRTHRFTVKSTYRDLPPRMSPGGQFINLIDPQNRVIDTEEFSAFFADSNVPLVPVSGHVTSIKVVDSATKILYQLTGEGPIGAEPASLWQYNPSTGAHVKIFDRPVSAISGDGRWVAYIKFLGSAQPSELYIYNIDRREERFVAFGGTPITQYHLSNVAFSADNRYLTYTSTKPDEVTKDTNGTAPDVFVYSIGSRLKYLASKGPDGRQYTKGASHGRMFGDGRSVVFRAYGEVPSGDLYPDERLEWPVIRDIVANSSFVLPYADKMSSVSNFRSPYISTSGRFLTYFVDGPGADTMFVPRQYDRANRRWLDLPYIGSDRPTGETVSADRELIMIVQQDNWDYRIFALHTSSGKELRLERYLPNTLEEQRTILAVDHVNGYVYHSINGFLGTMRLSFPDSP